MILYKYRGVQGFRFFVDIIMKQRLYAAPYFDLNDPMEGKYLYSKGSSTLDEDERALIKGEKEKIRICSLSRDPENELMWSHYAEGHRGVAIGVEVDGTDYEVKPIIYDGLHVLNRNTLNQNSALDVLSHKINVWEYEQEERVFVKKNHFVNVQVREVIFGRSMSNQDKGFIRELVEKIDPSIEVKSAFS